MDQRSLHDVAIQPVEMQVNSVAFSVKKAQENFTELQLCEYETMCITDK